MKIQIEIPEDERFSKVVYNKKAYKVRTTWLKRMTMNDFIQSLIDGRL